MYNNPPIEVSQVMFTVMAILGEEEDWKSIKNVTKNGELFINRLIEFDPE